MAATPTEHRTAEPVLPSRAEAADYVPARGGPVWRAAGDSRILATAGYALLLQVAHPTVGAGVMEFSDFRADPWGRLLRTLDYVHGSIYGGPELAAEIGARVRAMHRSIRGVRPDGERYHALEPGAYAWVHATLASAFVDGHRVLGSPMTPAGADAFWAEWRRMGRLIGIRARDLPEDWARFGAYFDDVVAHVLGDNPTVRLVLETLSAPAAPPLRFLPPRAWRAVSGPAAAQQRLLTVGMLPAGLRHRLELPWGEREERRFRRLAALSRASTPAIRGPLGDFGPLYVRARRGALRRGDVAAGQRVSRPAARSPAPALGAAPGRTA